MKPRVLLIDDDPGFLASVEKVLRQGGYDVATATNGRDGLEALSRGSFDAVVVDVWMPGMTGLEVCQQTRVRDPSMPILIMTASGNTGTAIEAMKVGAYDYVLKPFDPEVFLRTMARAVEAKHAQATGGGETHSPCDEDGMAGSSQAMLNVFKLVGMAAPSDVTVLIRGESGTGKELVARAIWRHSPRASQPFIIVNCAALPETLLESELFGHERGAFTGAVARRVGRFEQAVGGTIFLDEIGDMSLATQVKLLRVLQERTFERLGSSSTIRSSARVIAATHRDLEGLIKTGAFRADLFYRLNVLSIVVPPLRERPKDVPELAMHFLALHGKDLGKPNLRFSDAALEELARRPWPGNVRELEHCVKRAIVLASGTRILPEHLGQPDRGEAAASDSPPPGTWAREAARRALKRSPGAAYDRLMGAVEAVLLQEALAQTDGNLVQAAKLLGISRPTLRVKLRRYGGALPESDRHLDRLE